MGERTDRELLTLAAKAAGIIIVWHEPEQGEAWCYIPSAKAPHNRRASDLNAGTIWSPLEEDSDALQLAVKLELEVRNFNGKSHAGKRDEFWCTESWFPGGARYAATRRAITRAAAAAIGSAIESGEAAHD